MALVSQPSPTFPPEAPRADAVGRVTDPALSPDGSTIVFAWQDDLWRVPAEGGTAVRLTVHPAQEGSPVWSPQGDRVYFVSDRHGSNDVYSMDPDGGRLRRVTFDSGAEYPTSVSPDGATVIGYTTAFSRMDLFAVGKDGGDLVRLTGHPFELEHQPAFLPDGSVVYCQGGSPGIWRKPGHKGANTSRLYRATFGAPLDGLKRITGGDRYDLFPTPLGKDRIVFVSNRSGAPNLWSMPAQGGTPKQHTRFERGTVRAVSASRDGSKVAFQKDSAIHVLDTALGTVRKVQIAAPADSARDPELRLSLDADADAFVVSPNGKRAVIEVRGDLFLLPEKGGTTRRLTVSPGLDTSPAWLSDDTVVYVAAAESGKRELRTVKTDGSGARFLSDALDLTNPVPSPDRSQVAFHRGDREIALVPASGGTARTVAQGAFGAALTGPAQFSWSPDGKWLAYSTPLTRSVAVFVVPVAGGAPVEVARLGKSADTPVFSPDGKYVAFSAVQGVDYSETRDTVAPLYSVRLEPRPLEFSEDDLDALDKPKEPTAKPDVKVDPDRIRQRLVRTSSASVGGVWPGPDGAKVYANVEGQLSVVDLATSSARPVAGVTGAVSGLSLAADGKKAYYLQAGKAFALPTGAAAPSPVPFRAEFTVSVAAEERALFDEVWWALDRMYYDPKMHGKDWARIRGEFAEIVPTVQSRGDFYDLMGEMMELLDSSHLGATAPPGWSPAAPESTAWLGVEWDWGALLGEGVYRVGRAYPDSPASHPGSRLVPGDVVESVDGVRPSADEPMARLLDRKSGRRVVLGVRRGGERLEVPIKPFASGARSGVLYRDWVERCRAETERLSGGKVGYVHIQGMDVPSLDTFLRESQTELEGKEAAIVDVRFNGGGFTAHIVLNIIRKTPWLVRTNRDEPGAQYSENSYRGNAFEMPAACLANQYSFSNAEIFSEGFRRMGLGPVVGEATAGGVIGTGGYGLWDGGFVRMPASGAYAMDGENLEGNGRQPNVKAEYDPAAWMKGRDVQIEAAVKALLQSR